MLSEIKYTTLFVEDQERALDFYINTLGFEKREENRSGRVPFVTVGLAGHDLQVALWPGTPGRAKEEPGPVPGACIIASTALRDDFERLRGLGVKFVQDDPVVYPGGTGYIDFLDPDGNRLSLRGPESA
jgi:catechol 2,3-dioxygenase-like lactoylglutathione lyase family enzyme